MKSSSGEWGEWKKSDMLLIIDLTSQRITIYSDKVQKYDIAKMSDKFSDKDGDTNFNFTCVDQDGDYCTLTHCFCESQNGKEQLYVRFSSLLWVYYLRKLD